MRIYRLVLIAVGISILAVLITVGTAYFACAMEWSKWAGRSGNRPVVFGHGTPSHDGLSWYWLVWNSPGRVEVVSTAVPSADLSRWMKGYKPLGSAEGASPWWSFSAEQMEPPNVETPPEMISADNLPSVADIGFGWPLPCISYRVSYLEFRKTTAQENAALKGVGSNSMYAREPKLEYGIFNGNFLIDSGHSGWWPTRVLWSSLIVDVFVVSIILLLPLGSTMAFFQIRAKRRKTRGECTRCGYSRAATNPSNPCPECGGAP